MEKSAAVASLGQQSLLLPAWIKAALAANDRLKLCLTLLQAAVSQALNPQATPPDLSPEMAAAGLDAAWCRELPGSGRRDGEEVLLPALPELMAQLERDLGVMARPLLEPVSAGAATLPADERERVAAWLACLADSHGTRVSTALLHQLSHGHRGAKKAHRSGTHAVLHGPDAGDSLHLLVMDLHKQLNVLAAGLCSELLDGAHVWQLRDEDRPRVQAFMRGLQRTRGLKFDHPGLDTAATSEADRLLIQNDIGTNDAHVLVIQVQAQCITLTYSDLHRARFAFFQAQLAALGAQWSAPQSRLSEGLNRGEAYLLGTASFQAQDEAQLLQQLEGLAARVVFLIDWNRARKRLQLFVGKAAALRVLEQAAAREVGHMGWLRAGGEQLLFSAMQAMGDQAFRVGERLDEVLGEAGATDFLLELLALCTQSLQAQQPRAQVADEARLLLARRLQLHAPEFDLLAEHAALCQSLAASLSEALSHRLSDEPEAAAKLARRAKLWEREADELVMAARERALRQPRWLAFARMIEKSDDAADALEECAYLVSLISEHHEGWNRKVRESLARLAEVVLQAAQEQVKALAIARHLSAASAATEHEAFIAASWGVLRAESECDQLLRQAKRCILAELSDAASLLLAHELAQQLERASDCLLNAAYALRELAFGKAGVRA